MTYLPRCLVLMATYNGGQWIADQLKSIYQQTDVEVNVLASDDASIDNTIEILYDWMARHSLSIMPATASRFKSASNNFFRIVRDVDIGDADYVALADQDDIWLPNKLHRAIFKLNCTGADAYSSNVEAYWPDGKCRIVRKSHEQKSLDYLFESPGPGCTFVFSRNFFLELQSWVITNFGSLTGVWAHDWVIYAYARSLKYTWLIDDFVSMRYRQHGSNEIGANAGLRALQSRLIRVWSGRYREDILSIVRLVGAPYRLQLAIQRLDLRDKFWLIFHSNKFRRSFRDVLIIAFFFILMRKRNYLTCIDAKF